MRGIVLAGGTGSRLSPLTIAVNKHLLPVGLKPMIYWPLFLLSQNGIRDITIVSSAHGVGQLAAHLGGDFGYRVQDKPGGIAEALYCAKRKHPEPVAVILGDNVFLPPPKFPNIKTGTYSNYVFLKKVEENRIKEFGVPTFSGDVIRRIDEKPTAPSCNFAVTGLYLFSEDVFDKINTLAYSSRGEMEVTDLLNLYAAEGRLGHQFVNGFWGDAGTFHGIEECSLVAAAQMRNPI